MTDTNSASDKDSRCEKKRGDLKKEKWMRQIKSSDSSSTVHLHSVETKSNVSESDLGEQIDLFTNKFNKNLVANPKNFQPRNRSESPPPKSVRSKKGINRGNPPACSYCRPEIHQRMTNTSLIRSEMREIKRADFQIEED